MNHTHKNQFGINLHSKGVQLTSANEDITLENITSKLGKTGFKRSPTNHNSYEQRKGDVTYKIVVAGNFYKALIDIHNFPETANTSERQATLRHHEQVLLRYARGMLEPYQYG